MSEVLKRRMRCAVYTRKSTDEGLDQEYNSIDAQRDAGAACIASRRAPDPICFCPSTCLHSRRPRKPSRVGAAPPQRHERGLGALRRAGPGLDDAPVRGSPVAGRVGRVDDARQREGLTPAAPEVEVTLADRTAGDAELREMAHV
mgnify:CR=1 FL=1